MHFWPNKSSPGGAATAVMALAIAIALGFSFGASQARADAVAIIVNGQQVTFDQPPIERAGRVFVPLRGVFERLGASVVYDNGTINATGNGHMISVRIGSTAALVDGENRTLDVAPFIVRERTLVPLRFISEALGATVDYDDSTRTVTIAGSNRAAQNPAPPPAPTVRLTNLSPAANSTVAAKRPAVSAKFSRTVDPNSVKITLDDRDVSSTTFVSPTEFLFSPNYDLSASNHTVQVTGKSSDGVAFDRSWSFTSGTSVVDNFIRNANPADGSSVGSTFTISGVTLPNSSVRILAAGRAIVGGLFAVGTGTYVTDITADSSGHFSQQVSLDTSSPGDVSVRITSTAPTTHAGAVMTLHYRT